MMNVAGKPMIAATGAAKAQNISMTMRADHLAAAPDVAVLEFCASPFSHAARRARCSGVTCRDLSVGTKFPGGCRLFHFNSRSPPRRDRTLTVIVSPGFEAGQVPREILDPAGLP